MKLFPELLAYRGLAEPERLAYRFFESGHPAVEMSFGSLWREAANLALMMTRRGWRGERALLVCRSERHFVVAFHACLLAGVVAVPTAPPRRQQLHERLRLLAADAAATALICDIDDLAGAGPVHTVDSSHVIDMRQCRSAPDVGSTFTPAAVQGDSLAFLQYTSGSTGSPKGVAVTHANLVANSEAIRRSMGMSSASSVLIALPLFHDMGLVGGVLQSIYVGCATSFMSPAELVQYPERWLQRISSLRVTTSGGPNFIYDLAAREVAPEILATLDLSCWQVAFCGAEPIRASTVTHFMQRFETVGFGASAFYPCYGMAEATLFITGKPLQSAFRTTRHDAATVVSCGVPGTGVVVRIVDPTSMRLLADGEVGEIWVGGDSVAHGYWGREALSDEVFRAAVDGDAGSAYLRTGDLGWVQDGELFVSGRLKDMIVVNGRKYAPQDIEAAVEVSSGAIRHGGVAAFAVEAEERGERVVVVAELERTAWRAGDAWEGWIADVRRTVHRELGLSVAEVVFIKPGALPRTSSGKVRRSTCRADYLAVKSSANEPTTA